MNDYLSLEFDRVARRNAVARKFLNAAGEFKVARKFSNTSSTIVHTEQAYGQ